ncbi:MAG: aminotransferase class I/II-fold pyridoxal phosphate-dependent enzyme [Chitinivibrionales bacterium]|nr:aminotransferase class I/II-fold pyridoxal phosphate-dependent enzyme [Chitinivibrionales bacterium]
MASKTFTSVLEVSLQQRSAQGILKGKELIITGFKPSNGTRGPRYLIEGMGEREFLKMNSNAYLGFPLDATVMKAEEDAVTQYGCGPGAVRFINGTYKTHRDLEKKLAHFHHRDSAILFSSAYSAIIGIVPALVSEDSAVVSDELNHNCIITALKICRPKLKEIYKHCDISDLQERLKRCIGAVERVCIITDGIFSMRGDYAPLQSICSLAKTYNHHFPEGIITIVDDSHGIGAFGATGRGVEEVCDTFESDVLVGTLGKAFGVNGGYAVAGEAIVNYLRETATTYIYTNPITPGEAAAASAAVDIVDSSRGHQMLAHLRNLTKQFQEGLRKLGFEIIEGHHPIVPFLIRDTKQTKEIVAFLNENNILATGLTYPVVPRGSEEIRFQCCSLHTPKDIEYVLEVLKKYQNRSSF